MLLLISTSLSGQVSNSSMVADLLDDVRQECLEHSESGVFLSFEDSDAITEYLESIATTRGWTARVDAEKIVHISGTDLQLSLDAVDAESRNTQYRRQFKLELSARLVDGEDTELFSRDYDLIGRDIIGQAQAMTILQSDFPAPVTGDIFDHRRSLGRYTTFSVSAIGVLAALYFLRSS